MSTTDSDSGGGSAQDASGSHSPCGVLQPTSHLGIVAGSCKKVSMIVDVDTDSPVTFLPGTCVPTDCVVTPFDKPIQAYQGVRCRCWGHVPCLSGIGAVPTR